MYDFPNKLSVIEHVQEAMDKRLLELEQQFTDLQNSLLSDTKSSAGDKHETARAMTQLEIEKLGKQVYELRHMLSTFLRINSSKQQETIQIGSLIHSSEGWYFISIPLGKLTIDKNSTLFCMSALSPLGKLLVGKNVGDKVYFNSREIEIYSIL